MSGESDNNVTSQQEHQMAENKVDILISNVVCSYSTRCHLNLRRIAMEGMHVEYKRENNMVNMRLRKPLSTATIWSSGKITCTGATSEPDAYKAARRFCRLLQKMKFKVKLSNYRVVNVLGTCAMPFDIDLNRVADAFRQECSYEPELHPGATFKLKEFKATLKLFTTGSITLTAPSVGQAQKAVNYIYPVLEKFKRVKHTEQPQQPAQCILVNQNLLTFPKPECNNLILSENLNLNSNIINNTTAYEPFYQFNSNSNTTTTTNNTNTNSNIYSFNTYTTPVVSGLPLPAYHHHHHTSTISHCYNDSLLIDNVFEDFLQ